MEQKPTEISHANKERNDPLVYALLAVLWNQNLGLKREIDNISAHRYTETKVKSQKIVRADHSYCTMKGNDLEEQQQFTDHVSSHPICSDGGINVNEVIYENDIPVNSYINIVNEDTDDGDTDDMIIDPYTKSDEINNGKEEDDNLELITPKTKNHSPKRNNPFDDRSRLDDDLVKQTSPNQLYG